MQGDGGVFNGGREKIGEGCNFDMFLPRREKL